LVDILRRVDQAIRIPISTDVFGLTALRRGDPAGLGQSLEHWVPYVEIFSPMLYINGMQSLMPPGKTERAGRLIYVAVKKLRDRIGPVPVIRPFMQAFAAGADYYTPEFIAEQVRGARTAGGDGFLFWHPGSSYGMVQAGMAGPAKGMTPFPLGNRKRPRTALWKRAIERAAAAQARVAEKAEASDARASQDAAKDAARAEAVDDDVGSVGANVARDDEDTGEESAPERVNAGEAPPVRMGASVVPRKPRVARKAAPRVLAD
jgi:hypothetical protein